MSSQNQFPVMTRNLTLIKKMIVEKVEAASGKAPPIMVKALVKWNTDMIIAACVLILV
uniref:Uncharacterized protein n=1 Tax=Ciona intestinalis TaxID=7719 RepID=H2XV18_CIOIN